MLRPQYYVLPIEQLRAPNEHTMIINPHRTIKQANGVKNFFRLSKIPCFCVAWTWPM